MIKCDEMRPQIAAMLDRDLTPTDAAEVEAHMKECAACAKVLDDYRALKMAAAQSSAPDAVSLWARIDSAIADTPDIDMLAEMRLMRQEMQAMREEVAALRRELAKRPAAPPTRTPLSLSDAPGRSTKPYQLV